MRCVLGLAKRDRFVAVVTSNSRSPTVSNGGLFFAHKALQAFSKRVAPRLRLSQAFLAAAQLDSAAIKLDESIGLDASALSVADGLNFITSLYPILLAPSDRSDRGAFYTQSLS
jgi:hypothetical protein